MINQRLHQILLSSACRSALSTTFRFVICAGILPALSVASPGTGPGRAAIALAGAAEPPAAHSSVVRAGSLDTRDGLTLRLTADLGSVRILQLEAGAAPVVRYLVHIEMEGHG